MVVNFRSFSQTGACLTELLWHAGPPAPYGHHTFTTLSLVTYIPVVISVFLFTGQPQISMSMVAVLTAAAANVEIIVPPITIAARPLYTVYVLELLYSLMQTAVCWVPGQLDDWREKQDLVSPLIVRSEQEAGGPSLWWQTVPRPCCSHWKGAVAKGSPTTGRNLQCRGVSRVKTTTRENWWCRPQAVGQVRQCCAMHTVCQSTQM